MKITPSATTADVISTSLSIKISLCDVGRISKSIIASSVSELAALADAKIANGKRSLRKSKVDPHRWMGAGCTTAQTVVFASWDMIIGYARVSTKGQNFDGPTNALKAAGAERPFYERVCGAEAKRPAMTDVFDKPATMAAW